ncbi:MAG: hypothetical protein E5299_00223 [Burkholderia gladioli]|nr:MAG: hypothetical protein E5299_00223 [Burkholderia gladioli]
MRRPETVSGKRLEPIHRILGKRLPVVATVLLPFSTTVTGNCINRAVTPHRTGRIRWTMSCTLAWLNRRNSTACSNGRMGARCCINRARSVDVYAQRSRGQPPIKSDSRVTA